jgi:hypothetical protein
MADTEAEQKALVVGLVERVRTVDRGGRVPRPDVGDAGRDDEPLARLQQQCRV